MTKRNVKSEFVKYVSFNIIGMIGLSCYILADTFFIAQGIGADGLTALNIALPVYSFISGVGLMIGIGGATRYAISNSKNIFTQSLYYTGLMTIIFVIAGIFFSEEIARVLGANDEVFINTNIYVKTILCFSPMFLLNNVIICYVRNDKNPKLSMIAMLVGSFSNILLDYIFIFPLNMGIFGAALATGFAPLISLMVLSSYFIRKKNRFHIVKVKPRLKKIFDISALGVSALITELSSGIVIIVFNIIILGIAGNIAVAAYGVVANIALVITAVFTGVSQGVGAIVSRCFGEGDISDAKKALKYAIITSLGIATVVYSLSFVFSTQIVAAFNESGDIELAGIATNGLHIYFISFVFVGINIVIATYFSAIGVPKTAFIISLLRGFILIIPITIILSWFFGINGVWFSVVATELIVMIFAVITLKKSKQ